MPSMNQQSTYSQVPHDLLTSGVSAGAIKTYAIIRMKAWKYGSHYLSGVESLAEDVGVSRQSVSGYLDELEALRAIERIKRPYGRAIAPLLVTTPSVYDHEALAEFVRSKGKAGLAPPGRSAVKRGNADVRDRVKPTVNRSGRQSSSGGDISIEEDSLKKSREESRNSFLEEEEVEGEREWWVDGEDLYIRDQLDDSPHAHELLRITRSAMEADRVEAALDTLTRLQDEAPRLKDAAHRLSDWWLEDVGF